jgi:hypothetical protein
MVDIEGQLNKFSISLICGFHIGERALLDIKLIWFGYIARLIQWGGGGTLLQILLPSSRL